MIYTFYSFKGGVGRSMAAANVAKWFYLQGLRVVMVDWDLEAPGLENFFFPPNPSAKARLDGLAPSEQAKDRNVDEIHAQLGLIDLLEIYRRRFPAMQNMPGDENTEKFAALLRERLPSILPTLYPIEPEQPRKTEQSNSGLWLLPAGLRAGDRFKAYAQLVQSFDWANFYASYRGLSYFEWMREQLNSLADIVIIDSRTGVTEMGGVCVRQMADVVVCFCAPNFQNLDGLVSMMDSFNHPEVAKLRGRQVEVVAVPSRLDNSETDLQNAFKKEFVGRLPDVPRMFRRLKWTFWDLKIPYIAKYAYQEKLAIGEPDRNEDLEAAYRKLALRLAALAPDDNAIRTCCDRQLKQEFGGALEGTVLFNVPALPPHYLAWGEALQRLKDEIILGPTVLSTTRQCPPVAIQGMGGIGKSVLAAALAHDLEVQNAFQDGTYWLHLGQKPNLIQLQEQLARQLASDVSTLSTEQERKDALRMALKGRNALVVLDDVWAAEHVDAFDVASLPTRLVLTTRNSEVLVALGAREHRVDLLPHSDALELLAAWSGEHNLENLPQEAAEIAKECGYLPLALAMIGSMLRLRPTAWKDALTRLRRSELAAIKRAFPDYPYPDLLRAFDVSVEALGENDRERYFDLAVFPKDQSIPESALQLLWKLDELDTRDCMARLVSRSLAFWSMADAGEALALHDLQRHLIYKRRETELARLHNRFVNACNELKLTDSYMLRWLPWHLKKAGRADELRELLLNFDWLQAKLQATDVNALLADYEYLPEDTDLRLLQSTIRLSAHILVRDVRQLPAQLIFRLLGNISPRIQALLAQAAKSSARPWLRPLRPSLMPPGGSLICTFEGHSAPVFSVAIAPDGCRAVSASWDRTLRVWDLESGQTLRTLKGHSGPVASVAITPDGCRAVSASWDRTLRVWDLESGQTVSTLEGHGSVVRGVAITPDGLRAVSASWDKTLRVWDLESGETISTLKGHRGVISGLAIAPDGDRAVSVSHDETLRVWDLQTGRGLRTLKILGSMVAGVAITPDGGRVVSASHDKMLRVWDLQTGQAMLTLEGHSGAVRGVAVMRGGYQVVSASDDKTLRVWDLESGRSLFTLEGHNGVVNGVAVTPDGRRAVSASRDKTLRVWDLESGQAPHMLERHGGEVRGVAVTPDGRQAVSASWDKTLRVWDLESGQIIRTLKGHKGVVSAVAITPDGCGLISASDDKTLRVWDLENSKTVHTLEGHSGGVNGVAITPDGRRAVSASWDKTLRVWDLKSAEALRTLKGHSSAVRAVAVMSDGRRAVSASWDKTLRIWDLESGQAVRTLKGHRGAVSAVAVTPDGSPGCLGVSR